MIHGNLAESPKEILTELLAGMPATASWDDIEYAIYVRRKIQEGQEAIIKAEYLSSEEAKQRLQQWLK